VDEPKIVGRMLKKDNLTHSDAFKKMCESTQSSLLGRVAC